MAASPNIVSRGDAMIFTQSEATAAQRTWPFYLSNSADGTPATGKTIAGSDFRISKAGGAFGNATGTVTEISLGWYAMAFAAADLDTLGALACELSVEAGVDTLHVTHQVTALDLNIATIGPTAGSIVAASFGAAAITAGVIATDAIGDAELAADAVAAMQAGLATGAQVLGSRDTRNVFKSLGTLEADGSTVAISLEQAIDAIVTCTGTWDGSTVTVQSCADPTATVPVWTTYGTPLTADGTVAVTGPVRAIRATMSNDGAASEVLVTVAIRN